MCRKVDTHPHVEWFNQQAEVIALLGDESLLLELIAVMREEFTGIAEELAGLLEAGDIAKAKRKLHALKGVAGNLGIDRICAAVEALESKLDLQVDLSRELENFSLVWHAFENFIDQRS